MLQDLYSFVEDSSEYFRKGIYLNKLNIQYFWINFNSIFFVSLSCGMLQDGGRRRPSVLKIVFIQGPNGPKIL